MCTRHPRLQASPTRRELDMQTLVCTRGRDFPVAHLAERLRCPRCGCRRVAVMFDPPAMPQAQSTR
jgi:hypothetical protein